MSKMAPEYRLMQFMLSECGASLVDFMVLCTNTRHRKDKEGESELALFLKERLGRDWYMRLFFYSQPEIRVTVINGENNKEIKDLFEAKRLGRARIKKVAQEYCDWVACLFGLPVPLEDQPAD